MKWLLLSLLLINSFASLAEIELDEMKLQLKKTRSFSAIEKNASKAQQFEISKGKSDFGYKYWAYTFSIGRHQFEVTAMGIADSIQTMIAVSRVYDSKLDAVIYDTIVNYVNPAFAKTYLTKHNKFYQTKLSSKSFANPSCSMFGVGCGGAGSPTGSTIEMTQLVNKQDEKQLAMLASSVHANDRVHGTVGLYLLKRNGFSLSKHSEQLIMVNQESVALVNYCMGCTEGPYTQMNNLLTEKSMQFYWSWYTGNGWNKQ